MIPPLNPAVNEDERKKSANGDVSWKTERATLTVELPFEAGSRNFTLTLVIRTATRWLIGARERVDDPPVEEPLATGGGEKRTRACSRTPSTRRAGWLAGKQAAHSRFAHR